MTTLEVVVVIALVTLVASLVIPAVLSARSASRRNQCMSRLRQVVKAIHDYESSERKFPDRNYHEVLLSHLGVPSHATQTPLFVCPADPESIGQWVRNRQSFHMNSGLSPEGLEGFAPRAGQRRHGAERFRDGLSNTAAVGERLAWPSVAGQLLDWEAYPQWWNRRLRDTATRHVEIDDFADECEHRALQPLSVWVGRNGYNHILPPNHNSCINESLNDPLHLKAMTTTSLHPHGVNLAMGDGSVRFVSNTIGRSVWHAVGTRSGREITDSLP